MARSAAKKERLKSVREGRFNPELLRGSWNGCKPVERVTPSRKELQQRMDRKHKKKWNPSYIASEGSISFLY